MSKIQTIQPNYQPAVQVRLKKQNNPSFSGAQIKPDVYEDLGQRAIKLTEQTINNKLGLMGRVNQKLTDTQGEVQNQLMTALFTTTLAPVVIAWNPISHDDPKTKQYMAWRQPISAVIALLGGLPLTMMTNNYINKLGSGGAIKSIDVRMCPDKADKDFLRSSFRSARKEAMKANEEKKFLETCNDANTKTKYEGSEKFNSNGKMTKEYKLSVFNGYIEKLKDESKNLFGSLYGEHPDNIVFDKGVISVKEAGGTLQELRKNVPGFEKEEDVKTFIKENNVYCKNTSDFMKNEFNFEFFEDGRIKPDKTNEILKQTKAMDFLRKFGIFSDGKITEDDLNKALNIHRQKDKLEVVIEQSNIKNPKQLANGISIHTNRAIELRMGEESSSAETINLRQLFGRLGIEGDKLQEFVSKKMVDAQKIIADELKGKGLKDFDNKTVKEFALNVFSTQIAKTGKNFTNYKKYFGIAVNLPILAVTCTALNWAYPRIMEVVFPSLSKSAKEKKGGNK